MLEMITSLVEKFGHDLSPGRMFESVVLLTLIWSKLKPHLSKIEGRLLGVETAVSTGFRSGNDRFEKIEARINILEERRG